MQNTVVLLLLLGAVLATPAHSQTTRPVHLTTADNVGLVGTYYPVGSDLAPAVLLVHDLGQSRADWAGFALLLQQNGLAVLAIDLRGHGESTRRVTSAGTEVIDYHQFVPHDFQDMLLDVNAAADWLTAQPGIDSLQFAVIGAGLGANLALRYALFNDDLAGVVLISPGLEYRGVRTDDAIVKVGALPLQILVAHDDTFAFGSSQRLLELRRKAGRNVSKELTVCTGSLHGVEILQGVPEMTRILVTWLKHTLVGLDNDKPASPAPPSPRANPQPETRTPKQ